MYEETVLKNGNINGFKCVKKCSSSLKIIK